MQLDPAKRLPCNAGVTRRHAASQVNEPVSAGLTGIKMAGAFTTPNFTNYQLADLCIWPPVGIQAIDWLFVPIEC